jgi:predicted Zn-dependent protease
MNRTRLRTIVGALLVVCVRAVPGRAEPASERASSAPAPLMRYLVDELDYSMEHLAAPDGVKPYFLSYTVYDEQQAVVQATIGAIMQDYAKHERNLNIDVRVGDYTLDNTHQLRGAGRAFESGSGNIPLPLDDEPDAVRHALWYHTDRVFKDAAQRLTKIRTNLQVKVEEEDKSDDFSREAPQSYCTEPVSLKLDRDAWASRVREVSALAREFPLVYSSSATLGAYAATRYMVTSEKTRLQTTQRRYRITLSAATKADDGMELGQSDDFNAAALDGLPDIDEVKAAFRKVIDQVIALRDAPLAEPYIGPAILRNRASAVFFHEIFGHRIEGHRQKDVTEGQTFTKKVGEQVLPPFISIVDDPTRARFGNVDLRGAYRFDDEGVKAQPVTLVASGVLERFLMSRRPIERFPDSNGHGRRQAGYAPVSRQANLIVESARQVPFNKLREMLLDECRRQKKEYGLLFEDISGGFTTTSRFGPQSYKVLPIVVYRVFVDGRPDELIRGADIVGTPLTSFEKIVATADDPAVFNGTCGAESGWVPVSAISPSILVSTIEIEKRTREQDRPPLLESPLAVKEAP